MFFNQAINSRVEIEDRSTLLRFSLVCCSKFCDSGTQGTGQIEHLAEITETRVSLVCIGTLIAK